MMIAHNAMLKKSLQIDSFRIGKSSRFEKKTSHGPTAINVGERSFVSSLIYTFSCSVVQVDKHLILLKMIPRCK